MMQDANLKEMLYRHFRAQGWYALAEVPVYYKSGLEENPRLVTDVDVLGIRPSSDLCWEYVVGDCKTKKGESPANRTLWVRALIDQFHAHRAIVLLRRDQGIERDHKLFAYAHNVSLIEESEFGTFDRAIVFPGGSGEFPESVEQLKRIRDGVPKKYPGLATLGAYINTSAWNEPDHFTMIRKVLASARSVRREIEPTKLDHLLLSLEAAGVFAVGFATCVGAIFHQYLLPDNMLTLDQALKSMIWGGRENYSQYSSLRVQLAEAKGVALDDTGLALPEWSTFMQLVRTHLAAPRLAFRVPQLLRSLALDLVSGREPLQNLRSQDLMLLKFAMQTSTYYVHAAGFPTDTRSILKAHFLRRIGELTGPTEGASVSFPVSSEPDIPARAVPFSPTGSPDQLHGSAVIDESNDLVDQAANAGSIPKNSIKGRITSGKKLKISNKKEQTEAPGLFIKIDQLKK